MTSKGGNGSLICSECGEAIIPNAVRIVKVQKIFCRECWSYHIGSRFRKRLFETGRPPKGTSGEVFKPVESVLIVYDGSPSSVALINLVLEAILASQNPNSENPRGIPFPYRFAILVILESDHISGPGMIEKQKKHLSYLYKWTKQTESKIGIAFPLIATSIEMAVNESMTSAKSYMKCIRLGDDNWRQNVVPLKYPLPVEGEYPGPNVIGVLCRTTVEDIQIPFDLDSNILCTKVIQNLEGAKSSQKDFLNILKSQLIIDVARQLKVFKMIMSEDQTSLGIKMFSMMSLGRGAQVADQMSFMSTSDRVTLCRPLMDFSSEDLRQYLDCIPVEFSEGLVNRNSSKRRKMKIDTVDRQCDEFIVELQRGFSSTVSTLTRIGGKLQPSSVIQKPPSDGENSNLNSIMGLGKEKFKHCKLCRRHMEESDWTELCYGCSLILKDMKEPEILWDLLNFYQPTYAIKESTQEQKDAGQKITDLKNKNKDEISSTTNYKEGQVYKVTTYKGLEIIDVWYAVGSECE